jgi:hypothetical protein
VNHKWSRAHSGRPSSKANNSAFFLVVGSLGVVFIVQTIRALIVQNRADLHFWFLSWLVVALFVGHELLMLRACKRARRRIATFRS